MINLGYIWERRKVVRFTLKNWFLRALHEPFRPKGTTDETAIVFVRQNAQSRIFNHGYVFKKNEGIRTILITRFFEYRLQREAFDEIYIYYNKSDLQKKVEQLSRRYDLLAVVGSTQPSWTTRALFEMPRTWPVLIDQYDSYWAISYFARLEPTEQNGFAQLTQDVADEQFCFRHVDGIVARSGELPLLLKEHKISTPYILIEDGVNPIFYQPLRLYSGPKKEDWSVVYGGLVPMSKDSAHHGELPFITWGKLFAQEKIHFHIYPGSHHNYQYPEYEAEAARNPYFHIHPSVDFGRFQHEISQYDFAWLAADQPKLIYQSDIYSKYLITAKFYSYLEAGLPVIANNNLGRVVQILQETGAGFFIQNSDPKGLRALIEQQNMAALMRGIEQARGTLNVNNKTNDLMTFIREMHERYKRENNNNERLNSLGPC